MKLKKFLSLLLITSIIINAFSAVVAYADVDITDKSGNFSIGGKSTISSGSTEEFTLNVSEAFNAYSGCVSINIVADTGVSYSIESGDWSFTPNSGDTGISRGLDKNNKAVFAYQDKNGKHSNQSLSGDVFKFKVKSNDAKAFKIEAEGYFLVYREGAEESKITYKTTKFINTGRSSSFNTASMTIEDNLALTINATCNNFNQPKMKFTVNGNSTVVSGVLKSNNEYSFIYKGISSEYMSETIKMELFDGDTLVDTKNYSVVDYCDAVFNSTSDTTLKTLLADMLFYGSTVQVYRGFNVSNLPSKLLSWVNLNKTSSFTAPTSIKQIIEASKSNDRKILSASLHLGNDIRLKLVINHQTGDKLIVNDNARVRTYNLADFDTNADGSRNFYSEPLYITELSKPLTFALINGNTVYHSLLYNCESYINSTYNTGYGINDNMIKALYNYSVSANNYIK